MLICLTYYFACNVVGHHGTGREGIDSPAMVIAGDTEPVSDPSLRVCVLKREEGENFGFYLRVERGRQGHVIRQLQSWGVAERSGLKDGDHLLEVNEMFVDNMGHMEVARWIQVCGSQLCFLVLDGQAYDKAVSEGCDLRELAKTNRGEEWRPPRLCHITREASSGLGFSILPVEGEKGKFYTSPVNGGAAQKAGVKKGDRLIWINGAMASELTHSAISKMVKKCSDHMTVLVIDSESEKSYARRKMPILPPMADAVSMPYQPRRLHLVLGSEGYGFLLRKEKTGAGRTVHMVREVDKGSPAELGGVKEGEVLLEVNGEPTDSLGHDEVVNKIRQSGQNVTLTTMPPQGQEFYTKLGLSPLLFCVNVTPGIPVEKMEIPLTLELTVPHVEPQEDEQINPNVRLCVLQLGSVGFGFHLGCVQQKPGTLISQVAAGGPGQSSGLLQGDVVVEVNGQNVEKESVEDVILHAKKGGSSLSLLVVDQRGYEWLKKNEKPIKVNQLATTSEGEKNVSKAAEPPTE
ncbi:Na(+)/H(+) exchange regulatory cofactor NHE-RF3-like [Myxocyprinus asiaticus]|uniref:Na(+)/H(+) exchange regulatory cofactor NHE-RF3-like n=1 Tax=Myxocyprinus asiaticus TaxID=70543 RepID=UPI002223CF5C|nr:Na(+)/H(+) exchange regulatory cofactor NHE-RF3-like [Myxocyprinus asiaticus]